MTIEVISIIGIIIGLLTLMFLAFRGITPLVVGPIAAIVVALISNKNVLEMMTGPYMTSFSNFFRNNFLLFLCSAIFGQIMADTGATKVIAGSLLNQVKRFPGKEKFLVVCISVVINLILTYGGFSLFTTVFFMVLINKEMYEKMDVPWEFVACGVLGTSTATQGFLPGTPAIHNLIPMQYLGTTPTAAPVIGTITGIMVLAMGFTYIWFLVKNAERQGRGFLPLGAEVKAAYPAKIEAAPDIPLIICLTPSIILLVGMNIFGVHPIGALILGICSALVVLHKQKIDMKKACAVGSGNALTAIAMVCAIVGFGGVVAAVPGFGAVINALNKIPGPPIVQVAVGVSICAGITGSGSGGVGLAMEHLSGHFLDLGVNPQIIHRLTSISSCSLDTLPHCGSMQTFVGINKLPMRSFYYIMFMISVVITTFGLIVATILASLGFC